MNLETFLAVYDEFSELPLPKVNYHLLRAITHIDAETYGIHQDEAIGLLTAHYLALAPVKTATNEAIAALGFKASDVKSVEIQDDIVVEFADSVKVGTPSASSSTSGLDATGYGQQLLALQRSLIIPFTFT